MTKVATITVTKHTSYKWHFVERVIYYTTKGKLEYIKKERR